MKQIYVLAILGALSAIDAMAAETGLPWDGPMTRIKNSITGPVAYTVTVGGIAIGATSTIMSRHTDISEFGAMACKAGLIGGCAVAAAPILTMLYGVTGCMI